MCTKGIGVVKGITCNIAQAMCMTMFLLSMLNVKQCLTIDSLSSITLGHFAILCLKVYIKINYLICLPAPIVDNSIL